MRHLMKFASAVLLSATMAITAIGCAETKPEREIIMYGYEELESEPIIISNDNLELKFDTATTNFDITDKRTGAVWHSCAENTNSDPIASSTVKKVMESTLYLQYTTKTGDMKYLGTAQYSVEKSYYDWTVEGNSIKVRYTVGDIDRKYIIPLALPEEEFDAFYDKMDSRQQMVVDGCYRLYDINKLKKTDDKDELLELYPELAEKKLYILLDKVKGPMKKQIEPMFMEAGYTEEMYDEYAASHGLKNNNEKPSFNISIIYRLEEDSLVVEVPFNEINYKSEYPLYKVKVLPYFGAGSTTDEGYMLVPDGSGALINFNNQKTKQNAYFSYVYGWDYGQSRDVVVNENVSQMPIYGISKNGNSVLCVLEKGATYAAIEADVAGRLNSYNNVGATYQLVHGEKMDVSGKSSSMVYNYEDSLPNESLVQRYIFCQKDGYVEMAKDYRDYLTKNYPDMMKKETENSVPVAVDLIGAIEITKQILGVPTDSPTALTTYDQAAEIISQIKSMGWENVSVRYRGWFNGGLLNSAATSIKLVRQCGGRTSFNKMLDTILSSGYDLYMDGEFQFVYGNKIIDGYTTNRDSSKLVSRKRNELYNYHPVWFGKKTSEDYYYLAKPEVTVNMMEHFAQTLKKYDVTNYSFGSIGTNLGADYNPKNPVSREETANMQANKLQEFKNNGSKLMIDGGNVYASIFADVLVDAPTQTQGFSILDEQIPFYGIVFHGTKDYMGKAINLAEDYKTNLLRNIENGCGLYFVFMNDTVAELQETNFTYFYGASYDMWKDVANELYQRVNNDLSHVYTQYIVAHDVLEAGLVRTTYEDGTQVILNYNNTAREYEGTTVPSLDYIVKKGGK